MERSLPPDVEGPVYGELRVCVDLIDWSIARPPPVCQVRARFWGEKGFGCVFRPDDCSSFVMENDEERELESTSSNTVFYCVRVKSLLFSRYLKDMNVMTLEVLDGKTYAVLGKSRVNVGEGADSPVIADGLYTIFAPSGGAIGKLRVHLVVDYFETPMQAEQSFEELEDMIEMDTPLPLQHTNVVPLYPRNVGVAVNPVSLPPLLRSSVASVGDYEGSSDGGYLDVDASMSEDGSILRRNVTHTSTNLSSRQNLEAFRHRSGDSVSSDHEKYNDDISDSDICSSDSSTNSGHLPSNRVQLASSAVTHNPPFSGASNMHRSLEHSDSQHSDSLSPREKDTSMVRAAHLRSVVLQSPTLTSPQRSHASDASFVAPSASVDERGAVSIAINTSSFSGSQKVHARNESAAQTSPYALRTVAVAEASVDAHLPERTVDNFSRVSRVGHEQTVDRSLMTDQTGQVNSSNPPPAWNHILDSLSARLGAMRNRVVIAEQQLNYASSSAPAQLPPHVFSQHVHHATMLDGPGTHERTKMISFADEPTLSSRLHVAPYSPVRGANSSSAIPSDVGSRIDRNRSEKTDNVSLSELADVFNSHDEAALLSSLFFAKAQQPDVSTHQLQPHESPAHAAKSPSALKMVSSGSTGRVGASPTSIRRSGQSPRQVASKLTRIVSETPSPQMPKAASSPTSVSHSWFVSVDSISFASSAQKVSVKNVRIVIKVPPAANAPDFFSPSTVRVRWLSSRLPRHSLAVVFVDAAQASHRVTVPSAPVIIIEVWERDMKTLEPRIVGIVRCPVRAGVSSSPAGSRIKKFTSTGVWAAVLDSGNFIYDGTTSIRNPLSGTDVGHASISILQETSDIVDGVVRAADAAITISSAIRCHSSRKIFGALQTRLKKLNMRKELRLSRPLSRRAVVEIASDSGTAMFSHTFKVEVQGLFGIGDWSGASSICLRARFPGQKEWIESGRTAIIKGSAAALASSSYSWVLPANQNLSSVLTDPGTGANSGFCVHVHDGADFRRLNPPMRQYLLSTSDLLALSRVAMEMCLTNTSADVPNDGVKKIFRIPAREFGEGCVLKVVMHCRVLPSTLSTLTLTSLSTSSHPKLFSANNSFILGVICASGLQTAAEVALASLHSNSSLSIASVDGINAFATVSFTPPASHLLPGLNASHIYVTTVAPMTFAPKWDWKVQFPLQLSRDVCNALAVSSLTVSVYHRPISRVPGHKEEDVLIGHAAAPLAHLFTKHSGLATWVPLVCGKSGLPAASILLFSNIEAISGEPKQDVIPSALLCDAFDIDDTTGLTGVIEASLEELILLDGSVASLLGVHKFTSANVTWRLPGLDVIEVKANIGNQVSGGELRTSRVVSLQSSVSRIFDLSVDVAHCMNERAIEIDIALCPPDGEESDPVALGTCYIDASSLLDRPSQFELPTQARWSSGAFAVIHPSGSRCGAAVRVRLQLRFKKSSERSKVTPHHTNIISSASTSVAGALERSPLPRSATPQLPPLPVVSASTLILESVRHVKLPQKFESESVYLSLTAILDGNIVYNTAPILYSGKIDCEWEEVISLHSKNGCCDNITVILSAQNENNTKAAVLGSSEIDLSMLQLMKCISGWYSILDASGNCVAYVKLRVDSKSSAAVATPVHQEQAVSSVPNPSASVAPSTQNRTATTAALPDVAKMNFASDPSSATDAHDSDSYEYSAPSLEDLRSKMKELDSVSTHLKEMLLHDDWSGAVAGLSSADSDLCNNASIDSSYLNTDNAAPRALIAYAGAFLTLSKMIMLYSLSCQCTDSLVAQNDQLAIVQQSDGHGRTEGNDIHQDSSLSSLEVGAFYTVLFFCHLYCHFPTFCHANNFYQRLQRAHLDLQQHEQSVLIFQQQEHELRHTRSQQSSSSHQQEHQQHDSSISSGRVGKQNETLKSFSSSPSFRDYSKNMAARQEDSSSDSDSNQSLTSFVRADVHTTRRTDKEYSSSASASLHSASVSSLPSSVASSQEFQGRWAGPEAESPTRSVLLESAFHLR